VNLGSRKSIKPEFAVLVVVASRNRDSFASDWPEATKAITMINTLRSIYSVLKSSGN
jgi:hypothetical protein